MRRTSRFFSAIRSINSVFLYAIPWMFYCIILILEILKSWIIGGRLIGLWFYIFWSFISWFFSLSSCPHLAVETGGSIRFLFLFWILVGSLKMLGGRLRTGELMFVVSLAAAPPTRRYCFMTSFNCVSVSKTYLAGHCSSIIFEHFSFCLFSLDFYESRWFFFFESQ